MKKIVFLTGAGMSVESGFKTFRGNDGLWEDYPVEQVASHEGWEANPTLVNSFYNNLRKKLYAASPNEGHRLIKELEKDYDVTVVTQNVDNLHERAGSSKVIHLHGELTKVCSSKNPYDSRYIQELPAEDCMVAPGTRAGDGSLLRPFIVFFGEAVPMIEPAAEEADVPHDGSDGKEAARAEKENAAACAAAPAAADASAKEAQDERIATTLFERIREKYTTEHPLLEIEDHSAEKNPTAKTIKNYLKQGTATIGSLRRFVMILGSCRMIGAPWVAAQAKTDIALVKSVLADMAERGFLRLLHFRHRIVQAAN